MCRSSAFALISLIALGAILSPSTAQGKFPLKRTFTNNCLGSGSGAFGRSVAFVRTNVLVGSGEDGACLYDSSTGALLQNFRGSGVGQFGISLAGQSNSAVIGAPGDAAGAVAAAGAVRIFDGTTGTLISSILNPSANTGDKFGASVAPVGADVLVGSPFDDTDAVDAGTAYFFDATGLHRICLRPECSCPACGDPAPASNDQFGRSVAARYNDLLVSTKGGNGGSGSVHLFDQFYYYSVFFSDLRHTFVKPPPAGPLDDFGRSIVALGDDVVVGAPGAGVAYLFNGLSPYQLKQTFSNPGGAGNQFGWAVAAYGDDVLVGAPNADAGAVYLFDAATGLLLLTIPNPTPANGDKFGSSIATTSNKILVGAPGAEEAYLFEDLTVGEWGAVKDWPLFSIHGSVLSNGKALLWKGRTPGHTDTYLWDPANEDVLPQLLSSVPPSDLYCGGHASLADGRTLAIGGQSASATFGGVRNTNVFDPGTSTWTPKTPMAGERWYPCATTLRDGRVLATSGQYGFPCPAPTPGTCYNTVTIPEVYDVAANAWTQLTGASLNQELYPFMFLLPDGKVFFAGPAATVGGTRTRMTYTLDVGTQTWAPVDESDIEGISAAMYLPGKVLKCGGEATSYAPAGSRAQIIDMTVQPPSTPVWTEAAQMAFRRADHNLVLLPNGRVFAVGGSAGVHPEFPTNRANGVLATELWDPASQTWSTMASMAEPRAYHSIALLLPDARVLSAGGEEVPTAQIYSPPYLQWGIPRPQITSVPTSQIIWGTTFQVGTPDSASITSVALVRPGSVTHGFDQNQRYVPLTFTVGTGSLTVTAPAKRNIAPPGYYMLFIINSAGVPSVARFVQINGPDPCG